MTSSAQASRILAHLQSGKTITPLEALNRFGSMRLGARIHDLRGMGHKIESRMVKTDSGKRVSEYYMERS